MHLTRVFIENFRGIRRLKLYLDGVTVLIGENNHGKTSVFDALCLCLGRPGEALPGSFRRSDFHRPSGGGSLQPIRLSLTFTPDADAQATGPSHGSILSALTRDHDGRDRLRVELWGRPEDGRIEHRFVDQDGRPLDPQPPDSALAELRRQHPVLLLRFPQQPPTRPVHAPTASAHAEGERPGRRELEAEVAGVYHELVHTRGPINRERLRRGLQAAHELYQGLTLGSVSGRAPLGGILDRLAPTGGEGAASAAGGARELGQAGSGSHTLGLLLVLGAMLDGRGEEILPADASPIIAIEEPEVHLHPILLATTWDVIGSLNAQTLVTTNSGELLSSVPLSSMRRLSRRNGGIDIHQVHTDDFSPTELRRVGYHIRAKRGGVLFARCWLLVEGESEFWLMRELAHVLGYDLEAEGVRCVEFAQCGVVPLLKLAGGLGLEWHLLVDGDESGASYAAEASKHLHGAAKRRRVTRLKRRDIERCFWYNGYEDVYREAARMDGKDARRKHPPGKVIAKAVRSRSKPYLALSVAEAVAARGPSGVPPLLRQAIETSVMLARDSVREPPE
jgi:putative ATP-dependent endonuclease of OLD family